MKVHFWSINFDASRTSHSFDEMREKLKGTRSNRWINGMLSPKLRITFKGLQSGRSHRPVNQKLQHRNMMYSLCRNSFSASPLPGKRVCYCIIYGCS